MAVAGRREGLRAPAELGTWAVLVGVGLAASAVAAAWHAHLGTGAAPFTGRYRWRIDAASAAAPAVAGAVLLAVRSDAHRRWPWAPTLLVGWVAAFGWAVSLAVVAGRAGLAGPVQAPDEYLHDVPLVGDHPARFLREFVAHASALTPATRGHPPAPVLLLWALGRAGLTSPLALGLFITAVGCLVIPLVALAVRSLCGEQEARTLLPALVLAPYALWVAVSMDAVTAAICAAAIACAAVGSARGRTPLWAVAAGVLLGVGALFSYAVAWLGVSLAAVYFVRRRPLLNLAAGAAALVPLVAIRIWGFTWTSGLAAAQADFARRLAPHRSATLWAVLDLVIVLLACGPVVVAAAHRVRRTPGWPFLVGAGLAIVFAITAGLARGEVERSWLPFYPWLLVPASAARRSSLLFIGTGAAAAVVIEAALRSPW
ncbi:MAG: hypothetical protein ACYDB7_03165 [Mycobacteriales bacterium]